MTVMYTRKAQASGWLVVGLVGSTDRAALCEYTRVRITREGGGKTYFIIEDGYVEPGREAWLSTPNVARYLSRTGPCPAAMMSVTYVGAPAYEDSPFKGHLRQQWARMSFPGNTAIVTLNSIWDGRFSPIPPGMHAIMVPDNSHGKTPTSGYVAATPGMVGNDVWFPIGLHGSLVNSTRYIHVGHLSEGCVTVHQLEKMDSSVPVFDFT